MLEACKLAIKRQFVLPLVCREIAPGWLAHSLSWQQTAKSSLAPCVKNSYFFNYHLPDKAGEGSQM